jgi:hypothetical protein
MDHLSVLPLRAFAGELILKAYSHPCEALNCDLENDFSSRENDWLRGRDLNPRPSGYEPDELPGCSTPRLERFNYADVANGRKLKTQE